MAAEKSFTQQCMELGDAVSEAISDVASQHSSGSGSSGSGSGSGASSAAPSLHEAMHEGSVPVPPGDMPFDDIPPQPFEDPIPEPQESQAAPSSPLPPAPKPVQRRSAKQQAVVARPPSPVAPPVPPPKPAVAEIKPDPDAFDDQNKTNKQLITYVLLPALVFAATYVAGPMVAPSLFEDKVTKELSQKKALMAATLASCGAILVARCVL